MNNTPRIIAIIPARMGSSRFPGKPLYPINGRPMISHCIENAERAFGRENTWVATCDQEIVDHVRSLGSNVILTSASHERASDRTAEAASKIEKKMQIQYDIVVMLQGDEPLISANMLTISVEPLLTDQNIMVANLMSNIETIAEFENPNTVKVVCDNQNFAMYFSREPIPSQWKFRNELAMKKQVCSIPFRREFLEEFNALKETPIEVLESIDMMRVLEHGKKVKMVPVTEKTVAVDTIDDAKRAEAIML